jgi:hypothetical protein
MRCTFSTTMAILLLAWTIPACSSSDSDTDGEGTATGGAGGQASGGGGGGGDARPPRLRVAMGL